MTEDNNYVLGLGIGAVLIGIGYWMAKKVAHQFVYGGILKYPIYQHNKITKTIIGFGLLISTNFFIRILILLAL